MGAKGSKKGNADELISSELAREKMWSRIHLIPVLQAEEDRDLVRRHWAEKAREKELMGAESKIYNNDRYVADSLITSIMQICTASANSPAVSCAPHTQSPLARPPNRRRARMEWSEKEEGNDRCTYYGVRGVFSCRQPPAGESIKCSFRLTIRLPCIRLSCVPLDGAPPKEQKQHSQTEYIGFGSKVLRFYESP